MSKPAYDMPALGFPAVLDAPVPVTRPENATRSLFHIGSGLTALLMLRLLPNRPALVAVSGALAAMAWTCEIARRQSPAVNDFLMRLFSRVAHPQERFKVNSSTWYLTALVGLALLAPQRASEIAVVVLGVADPAAGFIGRRFGRTRLRANRSLEGTLGFVAAGTLAALGVLVAFHSLALPAMLLLAFAGAVAGAVAELVSTKLDDNFTIPVTVAAAAAVAGLFVPAG